MEALSAFRQISRFRNMTVTFQLSFLTLSRQKGQCHFIVCYGKQKVCYNIMSRPGCLPVTVTPWVGGMLVRSLTMREEMGNTDVPSI